MISEIDKSKIIDLAKKYNVKKIFLFGSSLDDNVENNDIDLAVDGLHASCFFHFMEI